MRKIYVFFMLLLLFAIFQTQCYTKKSSTTCKNQVKYEQCYKKKQKSHFFIRRETKTEEDRRQKLLNASEKRSKSVCLYRLNNNLLEKDTKKAFFVREKFKKVSIVKFRPQSARMYIKKEEPTRKTVDLFEQTFYNGYKEFREKLF